MRPTEIDAPVIMDFRRSTEDNPEDNCQYYNKVQLRIMAREKSVPVQRWEATYDGTSQEEGQKLDSQYFNGLEHEVECAVGARILLIHNLAVAHGLMNGTQGVIKHVLFPTTQGPTHPERGQRMPEVIIVDFPQYDGPPFWDTKRFPERKTWVPLYPSTRTGKVNPVKHNTHTKRKYSTRRNCSTTDPKGRKKLSSKYTQHTHTQEERHPTLYVRK